MRVCYFGTYRREYIRNRLMIDRLRSQGVEVVECHATLWTGDEDREQAASGGWRRPAFLLRFLGAYARLLWRYFHVGKYDVLMAGYPGQSDILLARLLSWLRRKPLVWDILMSIALIAQERGLDQRSPFTFHLIRDVERLAVHLPEILIIDTQAYSRWYQENYHMNPDKIRMLALGADDRLFRPVARAVLIDSRFHCLYYGTFIPNHGVQHIIEAARLLKKETEIQFTLIGQGPQKDVIVGLAKEYELENVTFIDWLEREELVEQIARADVCLGSFGTTPQSYMTVHNKIFEGLAAAKPVITGDSPAVREIFQHGEHLYLCERENPNALAESIRVLKGDPELGHKLAENGYRRYHEEFDFAHSSERLVAYLRNPQKC